MVACMACATQQNPVNATPGERGQPREYEATKPPLPDTAKHDPVPDSILDAIRKDARERSGGEGEIVVVSSEKVTWSDGALGCPQPGRFYTQALVPGFRVYVRTPRGVLAYHTDESGSFVVCQSGVLRVSPDQPVAE